MTATELTSAAPHAVAADDSAHFAALPASPLAAYALGMLHMLQRAPSSVDCPAAARAAICESDAIALQVLAFLGDAGVPLAEKHALVATVERAVDLGDVKQVLHLFAIADAAGSIAADASNQQEEHLAASEAAPATDAAEATPPRSSSSTPIHTEIPEALGCSICCDELMLKPVSLLCGHSFCKRCVNIWLKSCANCPTCRQPVAPATVAAAGGVPLAVNVALHELMATFFPAQLKQLEDRDELARLDELRALVAQSIQSGKPIRELVAQQHSEQPSACVAAAQADVAHLLESDPRLHEQLLAAEIRERLRKEKALREESRRRHLVAYCGALPASARAHVHRIHNAAVNAEPAAAPTPRVQSHRPVKKYVPPPPPPKKGAAFFGNLLRRLHHEENAS